MHGLLMLLLRTVLVSLCLILCDFVYFIFLVLMHSTLEIIKQTFE